MTTGSINCFLIFLSCIDVYINVHVHFHVHVDVVHFVLIEIGMVKSVRVIQTFCLLCFNILMDINRRHVTCSPART